MVKKRGGLYREAVNKGGNGGDVEKCTDGSGGGCTWRHASAFPWSIVWNLWIVAVKSWNWKSSVRVIANLNSLGIIIGRFYLHTIDI